MNKFRYEYKSGKTEDFCISKHEEEILKLTIIGYLSPIKTINTRYSSYALKHWFEAYLGFYMTNADFKKAMTECGFNHREYFGSPNWHFNVSQKSLNRFYDLIRLKKEAKTNTGTESDRIETFLTEAH